MKRIPLLLVLFLVTACGGGSGGPGAPAGLGDAPLVLAAGNLKLEPVPSAPWAGGVNLARLGLGPVQAVYDVTTPALEPFVFDAVSRGAGNRGAVRISVAHAADGGRVPAGGPETIAAAGVLLSGPGQTMSADWMDAHGDGFARMTLQGRVEDEQIFAVRAEADGETSTALVRVRLGPPSAINAATADGTDHPGVVLEQVVYSSDSWMFGLPTLAVSGDRSTIVCYEGDRADPFRYDRYELRLQHDAETGAVTGGGAPEPSPDAGNWRDHEIAALYNVLAIMRGGADEVELALSFDRGATIGQTVGLGATLTGHRPRLVQAAMALDYSLAVLFWRTVQDEACELVLVEGAPTTFDDTGSPTAFGFEDAQVIHRARGDVTPALMGATWSEGGDLVVGYAFTSFERGPDATWTSITQNRCYTRRFGEAGRDTLVEESVLVGKDPSVAVTGSGETLRVFFAYESRDGVRLKTSEDGGVTFGPARDVGVPGTWMPTVIARPSPGATAVDLLFLVAAEEGVELHLRHWDDYDTSEAVDYRLTTAATEGGGFPPPGEPVPPVAVPLLPPPDPLRITQVAWLGYDAVRDGDEIVVVYHEETLDGWAVPFFDFFDSGPAPAGGAGQPEDFIPAEPPPLSPGLTEPAPPPDESHRNQLFLLRIR